MIVRLISIDAAAPKCSMLLVYTEYATAIPQNNHTGRCRA
jgi:hypothetical protein